MRPDQYTKIVLTVIAACLMWLCLWGPGPKWGTRAEAEVYRRKAPLEVNIAEIGGKHLTDIALHNADLALPVRVTAVDDKVTMRD